MLPILQMYSYDYLIYILLSPVMQIFYFGVFSGFLFDYARNNLPNRVDVFIGKRFGNVLRIHTKKQPQDKAKEINFKGATHILDNADVKLEMKHGLLYRPLYIFDEDNATTIKTTKPNVSPTEETKTIDTGKFDEKTGEKKVIQTTTKIKGKIYPIDIDLESQWSISARKLYNWWKNRMMETTWRAVIGKTFGSDYITLLLGILLGAMIGAMGIYIAVPTHIIGYPVTTTITSHITNTTGVLP